MADILLEGVYLDFPLSYGKSIRTEFIDKVRVKIMKYSRNVVVFIYHLAIFIPLLRTTLAIGY